MRLGVLVTRRFVAREQREDRVVVVSRAVELPFPPYPGMFLVFHDAVEVTTSKVKVRVAGPERLGVLPLEVEVVGTREPLDGLEAALASGWVAEPAPESRPAA